MTKVGNRKSRSTQNTPELNIPQALEAAPESPIPPAFRARVPLPNNKSSFLSLAVMAIVVPGLFATVALPAYAFTPAPDTAGSDAAQALQDIKEEGAQHVVVDASAAVSTVSRDAFTATSAAEMQRAAIAVTYAAFTGPSAADLLANPPYPNFDLAQVANVALQYQGVPYRYGGANPAGFDCSGFVLYVYAQFGVALPHSVSGSAAMGTPIARDAAVPGDLVIMPGHSGIYMGGGTFIDAGDYGEVITVRPIYDDNYYIVRIGI